MAQQNSISNQSSELTVDPASASDAFVQFDESTVAKWILGNDATDDSFRLSQSSALGTTDTFVMTSAGERTMPLQPAFLGVLQSADTNVTGNNAEYTLGTNTALTQIFDQGNDFDGSTFTASVTGRFYFSTQVLVIGLIIATTANIRLTTSNRTYLAQLSRPSGPENMTTYTNIDTDMDAADTVTVTIQVGNEAANTADLSTATATWFSGHLIC